MSNSIAWAGVGADIDADGYDDLLVSLDEFAVGMIPGPLPAVLGFEQITWRGEVPASGCGDDHWCKMASQVALGSDGDGRGWLAVGIGGGGLRYTDVGACVFSGAYAGVETCGEDGWMHTALNAGGSPSLGDVDGDGELDLLMSAATSDGTGTAWLEYGPLDAPHELGASDVYFPDGSGGRVAFMPDGNADGRQEIFVGGDGKDVIAAVFRGWGR